MSRNTEGTPENTSAAELSAFSLGNLAGARIIDALTEGIMFTDTSGTILYVNRAAYTILNLPASSCKGQKFANLFFDDPENDAFTQTVVDAIYARERFSEAIVPFSANGTKKHLRVYVTFFPENKNVRQGYIVAFTDLSEIMNLRDIAQDAVRVSELNRQLTIRNDLLQKTFGMFLSDEVVRQLLEQPRGPVAGGSVRELTIMMSDLRGFTALSEQMDAEDLIDMLNHYLSAMTEVIQKRGGTIIEFIGDGIMAIFGAPLKSDTHAADAVCAALEMQAAMPRINQWNTRRNYPRLEMGIALNTGEVIVGNVGSKKRMKYGVVGSQVNLCGRIESYTTGGQVLISPGTRAAIASPLKVERELTVMPKGYEQDFTLSHITGIGEPYNVSIKRKDDEPKPLPCPIPVCFFKITGKHTKDEIHYGGFTALGQGTAVFQTDVSLMLYDNIQIQAGGQLLCKVIDDRPDSYLLQYTFIPSGYQAWVKSSTP